MGAGAVRSGADRRGAAGLGGPSLDVLPAAALRLAPEMVALLAAVGLDTVGELERTPRKPLVLRFGPELTRRLDQAHGCVA